MNMPAVHRRIAANATCATTSIRPSRPLRMPMPLRPPSRNSSTVVELRLRHSASTAASNAPSKPTAKASTHALAPICM